MNLFTNASNPDQFLKSNFRRDLFLFRCPHSLPFRRASGETLVSSATMNCSSNSLSLSLFLCILRMLCLLTSSFDLWFPCFFCLSLQCPAKCRKSRLFRGNLGFSLRNVWSRDTFRYSSISVLPSWCFALFGSLEKPNKLEFKTLGFGLFSDSLHSIEFLTLVLV